MTEIGARDFGDPGRYDLLEVRSSNKGNNVVKSESLDEILKCNHESY